MRLGASDPNSRRNIPGTFALSANPSPMSVTFSDSDVDVDEFEEIDSEKGTEAPVVQADSLLKATDVVRHLSGVIARYDTMPFGTTPTLFEETEPTTFPELGILERSIYALAMRAFAAEGALALASRLPAETPNHERSGSQAPKSEVGDNSTKESLRKIQGEIRNVAQDVQSVLTSSERQPNPHISEVLQNITALHDNIRTISQDSQSYSSKTDSLLAATTDIGANVESIALSVSEIKDKNGKATSRISSDIQKVGTTVEAKVTECQTGVAALERRIAGLIKLAEQQAQVTRELVEAVKQQEVLINPTRYGNDNVALVTTQEDEDVLESHVAMIRSQGQAISNLESQISKMSQCTRALVNGDVSSALEILSDPVPGNGVSHEFSELHQALTSLTNTIENVGDEVQKGLKPQARRAQRDSRTATSHLSGCWKAIAEAAQGTGYAFKHEMDSIQWALQMLVEGTFKVELPPQQSATSTAARRSILMVANMLGDLTSRQSRFFKELAKGNMLERIDITDLQGSWMTAPDLANRMADRLASQAYEMIGTLSSASSGDVNARNSPAEMQEGSGPIGMIGLSINEYLQHVNDIHQEIKMVTTLMAIGDGPGRSIVDDPTHAWHQGSWDPVRMTINSMVDSMNASRVHRRRTRS